MRILDLEPLQRPNRATKNDFLIIHYKNEFGILGIRLWELHAVH